MPQGGGSTGEKSKISGHSTGVFSNRCFGIDMGQIPTSNRHHKGSAACPLLPPVVLHTTSVGCQNPTETSWHCSSSPGSKAIRINLPPVP